MLLTLLISSSFDCEETDEFSEESLDELLLPPEDWVDNRSFSGNFDSLSLLPDSISFNASVRCSSMFSLSISMLSW